MIARLAIAVSLVFAMAANAQDAAPRRIALPNGLKEISGLAVAGPHSLFAHNDEYGIVYEFDLNASKVVRVFALGDPTVAADFEGIATRDGRIYLISSRGLLYEADIADHRRRVKFNVYDTGAGEACEVEGLARGPGNDDFLILCKRVLKRSFDQKLVVFHWRLSERRAVETPWLEIPYGRFLGMGERSAFRPAGLEWDDQHSRLIVVSSKGHSLYAFSQSGDFLGKRELSGALHPQAEGVALMASGDLVIADEGPGKTVGALAIYATDPLAAAVSE